MTKEKKLQRHKCAVCGRVRYSKFLRFLMFKHKKDKTRFGAFRFFCADNYFCANSANEHFKGFPLIKK